MQVKWKRIRLSSKCMAWYVQLLKFGYVHIFATLGKDLSLLNLKMLPHATYLTPISNTKDVKVTGHLRDKMSSFWQPTIPQQFFVKGSVRDTSLKALICGFLESFSYYLFFINNFSARVSRQPSERVEGRILLHLKSLDRRFGVSSQRSPQSKGVSVGPQPVVPGPWP